MGLHRPKNPRCPACGQRTQYDSAHLELEAVTQTARWVCTRQPATWNPDVKRWT